MKIRYRITLLFTVVVTGILMFMCIIIFYFSSLNRKKDFRTRLKNRAMTTANLLTRVQGVDKDLLNKIDKGTFVAFQQKSVTVYNDSGKVIYNYTDGNIGLIEPGYKMLERVRRTGEEYFSKGKVDAVIIPFNDQAKVHIVLAAAYDQEGFRKLSQLKLILLFSFFSGILITFISGLVFSKRIVRPIRTITNEVKEISSQNLAKRIDLQDPKDELYELSLTFNKLLNSIQESFEMQRRFIANASHELSTPLTSINSQLEVTLQNDRGLVEYKQVILSVYEDVRSLVNLTKSLLELAKASGAPGGMELSLIRMDELLMRLPAEIKRASPNYNITLSFETFPDDDDKLLVFGNSELLYSAVKNLAINACKYSYDHTAEICLKFTTDTIIIKVRDNGPGIKKEELELVFQAFFRGATVSKEPGFGLGLSLVSRIIRMHKGTVTVTNDTKGAIFTISIPLAAQFHAILTRS